MPRRKAGQAKPIEFPQAKLELRAGRQCAKPAANILAFFLLPSPFGKWVADFLTAA